MVDEKTIKGYIGQGDAILQERFTVHTKNRFFEYADKVVKYIGVEKYKKKGYNLTSKADLIILVHFVDEKSFSELATGIGISKESVEKFFNLYCPKPVKEEKKTEIPNSFVNALKTLDNNIMRMGLYIESVDKQKEGILIKLNESAATYKMPKPENQKRVETLREYGITFKNDFFDVPSVEVKVAERVRESLEKCLESMECKGEFDVSCEEDKIYVKVVSLSNPDFFNNYERELDSVISTQSPVSLKIRKKIDGKSRKHPEHVVHTTSFQ